MAIIAKKTVALAFIGLIVLGNIWLLSMFTGHPPPGWTAGAFIVLIGVLACGGLGLLLAYIDARNAPPDEPGAQPSGPET